MAPPPGHDFVGTAQDWSLDFGEDFTARSDRLRRLEETMRQSQWSYPTTEWREPQERNYRIWYVVDAGTYSVFQSNVGPMTWADAVWFVAQRGPDWCICRRGSGGPTHAQIHEVLKRRRLR